MSGQAEQPNLVLASGSAARRNLLAAAGLRFAVEPARVDEDAVKHTARTEGVSAEDAALLLAELKAQRVSASDPDAVVIGADQILVCEGEWFDKPSDRAGAREQLRRLRGHRHVLATAVTCVRGGQVLWHNIARPTLLMRRVSDAALEAYLGAEAAHLTASVGAYRIEGPGLQLFDAIDGDYFSIIGLPLLPLLGFLRQHRVLAS